MLLRARCYVGTAKPIPGWQSSLVRWVETLALVGTLLLAACSDPATSGTSSAADGTSKVDVQPVEDSGIFSYDADEDASTDTSVGTDISSLDSDIGNTGDGSSACPGGPGCPCTSANECDNGYCLQQAEGLFCAQSCTSAATCPKGFACVTQGAGDVMQVCVAQTVALCAPCQKTADCQGKGVSGLCLSYGDSGSFCGSPCQADTDCPDSYACQDASDASSGQKAKQCVLQSKAGVPAVCGCSAYAKSTGQSTACANSTGAGSCKGTRSCTSTGLSACSAATPSTEVCNAEDDNCNGKIDDLPADATCAVAAWAPGSGKACSSDSDCSAGEGCGDGKCAKLIGKCPGVPSCSTSGKLICSGAKTPKLEQCNGEDDDCDGQIDEDFVWLDPASGATVTIGQPCGSGVCAGGVVGCKTLSSGWCSTDDKLKPEVCDGQDNDCDGQTDDEACKDGDACTQDLCDALAGKCSHPGAVDCDDKNECTADSCETQNGGCVHKNLTGTSCSDGDACTVADQCLEVSGAPTCQPGAPAKCDDANACTDDSCDPAVGCVHLANDATKTCYSGPAGTLGVGVCQSGTKSCKDGIWLDECAGEHAPAVVETCNEADDTCDGKTDEGCKGSEVEVAFAAVAGSTASGEYGLTLELGTSAHAGQSTGTVNELWAGLLAWLGKL